MADREQLAVVAFIAGSTHAFGAQLTLKLDGMPAAHTTAARKRAVFYGALRYAVELDHLPAHPMDRVSWTTPKADDEIDQRVVINPQQAVGLLKAVEDTDPAMVGFFACMYYAALRPGEVVHLWKENCILPETGWGKLMLGGSTQYSGAWGRQRTGAGGPRTQARGQQP